MRNLASKTSTDISHRTGKTDQMHEIAFVPILEEYQSGLLDLILKGHRENLPSRKFSFFLSWDIFYRVFFQLYINDGLIESNEEKNWNKKRQAFLSKTLVVEIRLPRPRSLRTANAIIARCTTRQHACDLRDPIAQSPRLELWFGIL